jgi:hypothetical protein
MGDRLGKLISLLVIVVPTELAANPGHKDNTCATASLPMSMREDSP